MNFKKIISIVFVSAIFAFIFITIYKNWQAIIYYPWKFSFQNLLVLLIFLIPVYLVNGMSWYLVNKSLGSNLSYFKCLKILLLGNFGRFIPGGIWQYAGRIFLAKKEGVESKLTTNAIFMETFFTLSLGILISFWSGFFEKLQIKNFWIAFILIISLGSIMIFIARNRQFKIRFNPSWVPLILLSFSMQFIVDGAILFFLSKNATYIPLESFPLFIGIFAISWIFGFVTIFAPSGLGVQEVTMAALLSNYMPFAVASVVAISFRLSLLLAEVTTVSISLIIEKITS